MNSKDIEILKEAYEDMASGVGSAIKSGIDTAQKEMASPTNPTPIKALSTISKALNSKLSELRADGINGAYGIMMIDGVEYEVIVIPKNGSKI